MQDKFFKATTIVIPDTSKGAVLEEAFNRWSEEVRPNSILHVHYYHDVEAHVRGYQVVYEEPWVPGYPTDLPRRAATAHLVV